MVQTRVKKDARGKYKLVESKVYYLCINKNL
jgi:hypothetical protein